MEESIVEEVTERKSSKRGPIIRAILTIGVFVLVFGVILPNLVDYDLVFEAIRGLSATEIAALVLGGVFLWFAKGLVFAAARPGLGVGRATLAWLGSTASANSVPLPFDIAIRFSMYRHWGFTTEEFTVSTVFSGVWTIFVKLSLPVVAVFAQLIAGRDASWTVIFAVIGLVALGAAILVLVGILRSEAFARRVGDTLGRVASTVLGWFKRPALSGTGDRVAQARENASGLIRRRWLALSLANVLVAALNIALLTISLRFIGIGEEVLSWVDVLTAYAIVQLVTVIPITPGGVGIAELAYIAVLQGLANTQAAGVPEAELEALITAGVFIYRLVTWLLVILVGWPVLFGWRWWTRRKTGVDPISFETRPSPELLADAAP